MFCTVVEIKLRFASLVTDFVDKDKVIKKINEYIERVVVKLVVVMILRIMIELLGLDMLLKF
ncbi:MAG: hypothetical protein LM568_06330 [Desulfurococcaceae archaeon]|jgi:hypothetical protein|nr:hypothetical protein [Desulfurococcaceae archaeon]